MTTASCAASSRRIRATVLAAGLGFSFALAAALVTSVVSAAPAAAHAVLVRITPGANATLTAAPTTVVVVFDEPVSTSFATVVVTSSGGVSVVRGAPKVLGGTVTQALRPGLASGVYRIAYRVTSDDGHPVTGESRFTVKLAATATAATPASPSQAAPPAPAAATPSTEEPKADQGGWLSRFIVPISGSVALLAVGIGVLFWERRRR